MIKDEPPFDIAIIGGGISGIGIALEARKRGLRTALLEKNTLCGETSNAFLRVIHGGLRYLQKLDIPRTYESAYEQGILLNRYPEHIENLPCIMPLSKWGLKSKYPVFVGSLLYGGIKSLSGNRLPYPRIVNSKQAGIYAGLNTSTFQNGALIWHDAVVKDPASFTNTLKAECLNQSVSLLMPAFVKSIQRTNDLFEVTFLDSDNQDLIIRCRTCVNATGPWIHGFDKPKVITTK